MNTLEPKHPPGPDFVCIGMANSGTRWLFDLLESHADVRMPKLKELHFLDSGFREHLARNLWAKQIRKQHNGNQIDPRHVEFFMRYLESPLLEELRIIERQFHKDFSEPGFSLSAFRPEAHHYAWYESLFEPYRPFQTGDITPGYRRLPSDLIAQFHARYPNTRYLMMVRHPAERRISTYNKIITKNPDRKESILSGISKGKTFALDEGSDPPSVHSRWAEIVGSNRIHVVLLDDVKVTPRKVRRDVFAFLGLSEEPGKFKKSLPKNRKKGVFGKHLEPEHEQIIHKNSAEDVTRHKAAFGGASLNW